MAAVLEAWYPGEEDGSATAAVLLGRVDPSGHLPVTFPASEAATPAHSPATWPGVDGTVHYEEGLDIGYRYDEVHGLTPAFPFGFGLSYTSFRLGHLRLARGHGGEVATVRVTDTGSRPGTEVVQAYLRFPPGTGEPPRVLAAFDAVPLAPGQRRQVSLDVPGAALRSFVGGRWRVWPGRYCPEVGTSSASLPLSASFTPRIPRRA